MDSEYLVLRNLEKSYDGTIMAVDGVSLVIEKSEFVSFLGPSGSGKTTTLMMIAGFEEPTSGSIDIDGRSLLSIPAHKRNFGIVFQNYALFPHMSVEKNISYSLRMRKTPADEMKSKVGRAIDMVGLTKFADRLPEALSGGQQQRVALARALVFEPDLVLMDEPLGALDKKLREQMQIEIKVIQKELGVTMLYVTHDQTEALTMSDRIAVFNHGRIEQVATPTEIYAHPQTRFVAEFIGDSNMLPATVKDHKKGVVHTPLGTFSAQVHPSFINGDEVLAMVRPEAIEIVTGKKARASGNMAEVQVFEIMHHGDSILVTVKAKNIAFQVRVSSSKPLGVSVGDSCEISWAQGNMQLIAS